MQTETKSKIVGAAVGAPIGVLIVCLCSPFVADLWAFLAQIALPRLSPQGHLSLLAILATLCIVLGSLLYRASSKKLLIRKYQHLETRGFWIHRKTKQRVCGNCLLVGIESPLACFSFPQPRPMQPVNSWVCGRKDCKTQYFVSPEDLKELEKV
jgi:hypothetical protein